MVHGDTEGVSVTAAALTSAGVTAISIALTGTATNIGSTPFTMADGNQQAHGGGWSEHGHTVC